MLNKWTWPSNWQRNLAALPAPNCTQCTNIFLSSMKSYLFPIIFISEEYVNFSQTVCICTEQVPSDFYDNSKKTMKANCPSKCTDGNQCGGPNGKHSIYRNFGTPPDVKFTATINNRGCFNSSTDNIWSRSGKSTSHSVYTCASSLWTYATFALKNG